MSKEKFTPECCQSCTADKTSKHCKQGHTHCSVWRAWFREQWAQIRKAAAELKKKEEPEE